MTPKKRRGSPGRQDNRSETLCRNHTEPGGCRRKNCAFYHPSGRSGSPAQPSRENKTDCTYWMAGHCKKTEEKCFGKHDRSKCGSQAKKTEGHKVSDMSSSDFANTLAKAVSQGLAGGRQHAAQVPSQGQQQGVFPALGQQQMMPMMMMPGANMFYPASQQGEQRH